MMVTDNPVILCWGGTVKHMQYREVLAPECGENVERKDFNNVLRVHTIN